MSQRFNQAWGREMARYRPERRETAFLVLSAIFLAHALLGELIGGKLIEVGGRVLSIGVIPWPIVFVVTDLINEHYGPRAVRRLTLISIGLIAYAFLLLFICINLRAASISPVSDAAFYSVFGQSLWIIIGSIIAFAVSQIVDAAVFVFVRARTKDRYLWARSVGSTIISQIVDTYIINTIAFGIPGKLTVSQIINLSTSNYGYKLVIALATTPVIYLGHGIASRYFGTTEPAPLQAEVEAAE
jgi:queuosine precursor transporter